MMTKRMARRIPTLNILLRLAAIAGLLIVPACTTSTNPLAPILNVGALRRGNILVGFVNNTTARAVFTCGGYDEFDESSTPTFSQIRLEAGTATAQISFPCRRLFAVGSDDLVRIVRTRGQQITDAQALVIGVNFSGAPADDPLAASPTEGTAAPTVVLSGYDYLCQGLLLFEFVTDATAAGGFRIVYRFVPR